MSNKTLISIISMKKISIIVLLKQTMKTKQLYYCKNIPLLSYCFNGYHQSHFNRQPTSFFDHFLVIEDLIFKGILTIRLISCLFDDI